MAIDILWERGIMCFITLARESAGKGYPMRNWYTKSTEDLCQAILSLKTKEECAAFLEDICTIKEIQDISQRLEVARMLSRGISYTTICKETGASTATISRVSRSYEYGAGGYKTVITRLSEEKDNA